MELKKLKLTRKSQEEIVGFALIIIIVAVILLIFLGFSLRKPGREAVESYEVESFIQAFLQYTSDCSNGIEYLSVQKLIFSCDNTELCEDERKTCDVLNSTLENIIEESWKVNEEKETPVKGYELKIITIAENEEIREILLIQEGDVTNNYKGSMQSFVKKGVDYEITFRVYY